MATDSSLLFTDAGVRFRVNRRNRRLRGGKRGPWKVWGIRHVNLAIGRGEIVGVIGSNGAGKSTLLRLASGIYSPDEGDVVSSGAVAALLSPSGGLKPALSGWENIDLSAALLGLDRGGADAIKAEVADLAGLGPFMDAPSRVYSAGMKARLGFALAVSVRPDVLILDEVMAGADEEFRARSSERVRELLAAGTAVMFATHEVQTVAGSCDRLVRLESGQITDSGPAEAVASKYLTEHGGGQLGEERAPRKALAALIRDVSADRD